MFVENMLNPANEKYILSWIKYLQKLPFYGEYIHMGGDECYQGF